MIKADEAPPIHAEIKPEPLPLSKTLLLFGATGDLSRRMLLPSLLNLDADDRLPPDLKIVGTARQPMCAAEFRSQVASSIEKLVGSDNVPRQCASRFLDRLSYVDADAANSNSFSKLADEVGPQADKGLAIFLSTAPSLFETTIAGLKNAGLAGPSSRLALEKPVGEDLRSSREINDAVARAFPEERTFRIDHYLGKETVQNLLSLRFGNVLFEPLWNAAGIEHVQITVAETIGLEGRASYFDGMGSLRDMVQNHLLQLLALVAMESPPHFSADAIRNEKVKILQALRPLDTLDECVVGQYERGIVGEREVASYTDDLSRQSITETFVALKVHVDNWRWKGVPFYLRTGKRLAKRRSEIVVQFKAVPHSIFDDAGAKLKPNRLVISIQPDENIRLRIMTKQPGLDREGIRLREVDLDVRDANAQLDARRRIAYERLLVDLLNGDPTLFVRRDEVEAQWRWIDDIRRGWIERGIRPEAYPAGAWGPATANALARRNGFAWHD